MHRVTLAEASKRLSVPMGTLYSWVSRGSITPMAIEPDGTKWFALHELERINSERTRRKGSRHA
jgi:predicted site-specific integrase-resolvase